MKRNGDRDNLTLLLPGFCLAEKNPATGVTRVALKPRLSTHAAAAAAGLHPNTIRGLIESGELTAHRKTLNARSPYVVDGAALSAWLAKREAL